MSDLVERLRKLGNAGSTEARVALEAARYIEHLEATVDSYRHARLQGVAVVEVDGIPISS